MISHRLWLVGAAALAFAGTAQAQEYPTKPVTFITPAAAGNSPDVITRVVSDRLTQLWKQQVVVVNQQGAGGQMWGQAATARRIWKKGTTFNRMQHSTLDFFSCPQ